MANSVSGPALFAKAENLGSILSTFEYGSDKRVIWAFSNCSAHVIKNSKASKISIFTINGRCQIASNI